MFFSVSLRPQNYPSRAKERVGRSCLASSPELTVRGKGVCLTGFRDVGPGIFRQGKERALDGPRNYPSREKERYGQDWCRWPRNDPSGAKSACRTCPGIIRRGRELALDGPRMIHRGRKSVTGGTGGAGPGMIRWGQRARVGRAPELSVRGENRCGRDWWCWPRNDSTGAKRARQTGPGIIRRGRKER